MDHDTRLPLPQQRAPATARDALPGQTSHAQTRLTPPDTRPASLYIHIPFCFHKCHYCDFYSIVDTRDRQAPFTERLTRELNALAPFADPLRTIFVGGGTPTLLRRDLWQSLLATLHNAFDLRPLEEFTVECNPETADADLFAVLRAGGVDRLSMGAQSFNPTHLKTLERWHDPESVPRAAGIARAAGIERLSVDLIYAIPGQTIDDWDDDLTRALDLGTEHLSAYNLTYEPNTAMTMRLRRGEFEPTPETIEIAMFERTAERAANAGLRRYEVSNYARPGAESRHNLAYWRQSGWLAAGPSASAHAFGARWKNTPRLDDYLRDPSGEGFAPIVDYEGPNAARALAERVMTGLRLAEGLDARALLAEAAALNPALPDALRLAAEPYRRDDRLRISEERWTLTDAGMLFADGVASDLMDPILSYDSSSS